MAISFFHEFKRQTSRFLRSNIKTARLLLTDVTLAELYASSAFGWPRKQQEPSHGRRGTRGRCVSFHGLLSRSMISGGLRRFCTRGLPSPRVPISFRVTCSQKVVIWRVDNVCVRFKRFDRKRWRKAYKAMILVEHLLTHGPLSFADELQSDKEAIQRMCNFQYVDERGHNWGLTVKKKAERVLKLLEKGPFLEEERDRLRKATRGIEGFDSFNFVWPLTITVEEATQNHRRSLHRQEDDAVNMSSDAGTEETPSKDDSDDRLLQIENGGCRVGMNIHPAEELIPLLSCEEGRKIEVLSHQLF
ncbi:hypothetical protein BHE74_00049791 [Ensete ventricosum]|nr:hypothetical protein GW17_00051733 [Ensete ventricosum]RWW44442.1 hypothetical protein BHE74_00049791 [Ensete ventricosum]RZS17611.1 hypothetical protein BHM03_00049772 [Ensete ventricosum]